MNNIVRKLKKILHLLPVKIYRNALFSSVAAAVEHEAFFKNKSYKTIVDIGANKGQFALVARRLFPNSKIFSFDPLPNSAKIFNTLFKEDADTIFFNYAIGPSIRKQTIHISKKDDSSSLLGITKLQNKLFPGTYQESTSTIDVKKLSDAIDRKKIQTKSLLKLDVQGYEYEALQGCENLLDAFDNIYCECSFVELYANQKLAHDVIKYLESRGFKLQGFYNTSYDKNNKAIQSDFFFKKI